MEGLDIDSVLANLRVDIANVFGNQSAQICIADAHGEMLVGEDRSLREMGLVDGAELGVHGFRQGKFFTHSFCGVGITQQRRK